MTKHAAGKYGRAIGQKERKAGWPAPATAWCYLCNTTHRWEEGCAALDTHPVLAGPASSGEDPRRVGVGRRSPVGEALTQVG